MLPETIDITVLPKHDRFAHDEGLASIYLSDAIKKQTTYQNVSVGPNGSTVINSTRYSPVDNYDSETMRQSLETGTPIYVRLVRKESNYMCRAR